MAVEGTGRQFVLVVDRTSSRLRRDVTVAGGVVLSDDAEPLVVAFAELVDAIGAARAVQRVVADGTERPARLALVAGEVAKSAAGAIEGRAVADGRALVRLAAPAHLLVSDETVRALGPLAPGGMTAREVVLSDWVGPVLVHDAPPPGAGPLPANVLVRPAAPTSMAAAAGGRLVGRDDERAALQRAWQRAASGQRTVVVITGESGVGKTRLVADLAMTVHNEGGLVLYGHSEEEERVPHRPFVEALRFYFERVDRDTARNALGSAAAQLSRLVPELTGELGLPHRVDTDAGADESQLFTAIDHWLVAGSVGQGTLLVLDDVQWAPARTRALIDHLVASPRDGRLLIALLRRDGVADVPDDAIALELGPLDRDAVAELVTGRLGRQGRAILDEVVAATAGHPLYVVHLLEHLSELDIRDVRLARELLGETGVPPTLREVLDQRLSRVDEAQLDVLARAAVLGARFDERVLERIVPDAALVAPVLDLARELRLVERDDDSWAFSHAIVRAALSERLSATRRARLHLAAAEAIEHLHGDDLDDHVTALADHLVRAGGRHPRTVEFATAAGEHALQRLAADDAARWFRAALDAGGDRLDDSTRDALRVAHGIALHRAGDPAGFPNVVIAARAAAARGDDAVLVRAALGCSRGFFSRLAAVDGERVELLEVALARHAERDATRARLLAHLAQELRWSDRADSSRSLSAESLAIARGVQQADVLIDALCAHQATGQDPALAAERGDLTDELVEVADAVGDVGERVRARWFRADALIELGDIAAVDLVIDEAMALAELAGQPLVHWATQLYDASRWATRGDLDRAEQIATAAHSLGLRHAQSDATLFFGGQLYVLRYEQDRLLELAPLFEPFAELPDAHPVVGMMQAIIEVQRGARGRAQERLERLAVDDGLARLPRDELRLSVLAYATAVAHALGAKEIAGKVDAQLALIDGGLVFAQGGAIGLTGPVAYFRGVNQATMGQHDAAVALLERALERAEEIRAPAWVNRARLALADQLRERDRERARSLASAVAAELGGTEFTALRRQAASLLISG